MADQYLTMDRPYQLGAAVPSALSASPDAAAHLTGRDVAAANRAFAGTQPCAHCSR
ncbi:hypothetical protein ACF07T_14890 [Streptomyces sp. NPDC015184]|uniref:hypothetical protein n=1 Tax=Streptomyces sp. NPDC015184 TaxID=3364946 RepID=UPI0036F5CC76